MISIDIGLKDARDWRITYNRTVNQLSSVVGN